MLADAAIARTSDSLPHTEQSQAPSTLDLLVTSLMYLVHIQEMLNAHQSLQLLTIGQLAQI